MLVVQPHALVCLNRYPFAASHLLVAPTRHVADLSELPEEEYAALMRLVRDATVRLPAAPRGAAGMNVGLNLGRAAGAGIADHLHAHIVPRWTGDTNFMPVLGNVRVMPEYLDDSWARLAPAFAGQLPRRSEQGEEEFESGSILQNLLLILSLQPSLWYPRPHAVEKAAVSRGSAAVVVLTMVAAHEIVMMPFVMAVVIAYAADTARWASARASQACRARSPSWRCTPSCSGRDGWLLCAGQRHGHRAGVSFNLTAASSPTLGA